MTIPSFTHASDDLLVAVLPQLAGSERDSTAGFVAGLAEFDGRRLYLGLGFSSIYVYCAERLHLREGAAYRRIESARASRRFPIILEMLQDGRLSLATAALLGPKLTAANADAVLSAASFQSKRQVELLIATLHPQPPVPSVIRKLPEPKPAPGVLAAPAPMLTEDAKPAPAPFERLALPAQEPPASRRPVIAPLSEAHYKLQVTISASARERLAQIQDLMRHRLPSGDPAAIVEHALDVLHAELLKQKAAQVAKPRAGQDASGAKGRYIPASVRREVWRRDHGTCVFRGPDGKTCGSTSGLEFHHVQPFATGGVASAANIEMRCRSHNGFEWERHLEEETLALVRQT